MPDSNTENSTWNPFQGIIDFFSKSTPYDESEVQPTKEQQVAKDEEQRYKRAENNYQQTADYYDELSRGLIEGRVPSQYVEETDNPSLYSGSTQNSWTKYEDENGEEKWKHTTPQSVRAHDEAQETADYLTSSGAAPAEYNTLVRKAEEENENNRLNSEQWLIDQNDERARIRQEQAAAMQAENDPMKIPELVAYYDSQMKAVDDRVNPYLQQAEVPPAWETLTPAERYTWLQKAYSQSDAEPAAEQTPTPPADGSTAAGDGSTAAGEGQVVDPNEARSDLDDAETTGDPSVLHSKLYASWKSDDRSYYTQVGSELYTQYTQAQETFNGYVPYPDIGDFLLYATPDEWFEWEKFATDACHMYDEHVGENGELDYNSVLDFYYDWKSKLTLDKIASGNFTAAIDYLGIDYGVMDSLIGKANDMYGSTIDPHAVYANAFLNDSLEGPNTRYEPTDYDKVIGAYYDIAPGDQGIVGSYEPGSQYSAQGNVKNLSDSSGKTLWNYYDEGGVEGVKSATGSGSFGNVLQSLTPDEQVALGMFLRGYGFSDALPGLGKFTE